MAGAAWTQLCLRNTTEALTAKPQKDAVTGAGRHCSCQTTQGAAEASLPDTVTVCHTAKLQFQHRCWYGGDYHSYPNKYKEGPPNCFLFQFGF